MPPVDDAVVMRWKTGFFNPCSQTIQRSGAQCDMRLFGGPKIRLHADMQLQSTNGEPAATSFGHIGGFGDFGQAQKITKIPARFSFARNRDRNLDVIDGEFHWSG